MSRARTVWLFETLLAPGFSIDASVRVDGHDRHGVERLVRYCARPPFALERLHLLTPLELLDRLARLVPPPRIHRHRYHGVLAPNARLRPQVIALGRTEPESVPDYDFDQSVPEEFDG